VPLLIRWPGKTASRNTTPVSLTDLLASLMKHLTGTVPKELDGIPFADRSPRSLLAQESWKTLRHDAEQGPQRSIIRGDEKWVYRVGHDGEIRPSWYTNLASDPGERGTRAWPSGSEKIYAAIEESIAHEARASTPSPGSLPSGPKTAPPLEPHQREALRALGYLE
jgi:arylsulfatase A-like enzyme